MMPLEYTGSGQDLMEGFASTLNSEVNDGLFVLPEAVGDGFIRTAFLGPLSILIQQYELKSDFLLKRKGADTIIASQEITFSFRNIMKYAGHQEKLLRLIPSVQVCSAEMDLEIFVPAGSPVNALIISVQAEFLKQLLHKEEDHEVLQMIFSRHQAYLYDEIISVEMEAAAKEIMESKGKEQLGDFFLRLKSEELIYLFFMELLKRKKATTYPINSADAKLMYEIREKIIADLSVPPLLADLAVSVNMSESKMNKLFKQIFGSSIYNYYQVLRINEAANLIREEGLSVSAAGYQMGFTNLSHFSRIFEKHKGYKPKKYAMLQ